MPWDESSNPEYSKRLLRGHQLIENGVEPKQLSDKKYEVPSQRLLMLTLGAALAQIMSFGM